MFKPFLPIFIILCLGFSVAAQTPEQVKAPTPSLQTRSPQFVCRGNAAAGTTTRTKGLAAKSSDKHFLCAGDTLKVTSQGANLTEDPVLTTSSGVGYLFYDCPPSLSGPDLATVKTDPCLKKSPFNGVPPAQGLWLARGNALGTLNFVNTGQLQTGFNNGKPVKLYYAPVTVYDFDAVTATINEKDTACIHVNAKDGTATDTFSVVYLNAVKISNLTYANRAGSFTLSGGLPEYNNSLYSAITITKTTNPNVKGIVSAGPYTNGAKLTFTVPEDGVYTITATDGVSCDALARVSFPTVNLTLSNESVPNTGDLACVKLTTTGFTNVGTFQFYMTYNPALIKYSTIRNINPALTGFTLNNNVNVNKDTLNISWFNTPLGITLPANSTLFEICFNTIGPIGSVSTVKFLDPEIDLNTNVTDPNDNRFGLDTIKGSVRIGSLPVNVRLAANNLNCSKDSSGSIRLIPTGAGAPFTYTWRSKTSALVNGPTTMAVGDTGKINNLVAGIYYITITNAANDMIKDSVDIKEPSPLLANAPASINTCLGQKTGSLDIRAVAGGTPPYTYLWNTGATTSKIINLEAGPYSATVTDAKGCKTSVSGDIIATPIAATGKTITPAKCFGASVKTGSITISGVQGGAPPNGNYTFTWSNGSIQNGATAAINTLDPGTYRLTISDGNCTGIDSFVVAVERTVEATATVTNLTCNGANTGTILVTANSRGTSNPPYIFRWTGINVGDITTNPATTLVRNLKAGRYPLSILDQDGCKVDSTFTITQPPAITITTVSLKNESCLVGGDGEIVVSVSGGTITGAGYTTQWSRSLADNKTTISNLFAGTYRLTVTDNAGCTKDTSFVIIVPQKPLLTFAIKDATCFDKSDGEAKVIVKPPTGAVVTGFSWSNGGVTDVIRQVKADTYRVTVTLSNGCLKDTIAVVGSPAPLRVDTANSSIRNPTCTGYDDGQIILVMKGGTSPYIYTWSGGQPTGNSVFGSLKAGVYNFTVTDFNGCTPLITTLPLIAPPDITVSFTEITGTKCYGKCVLNKSDGKATASASGGPANTGIYTYLWESGESTARAIELCGGWQTIIVSDGICTKKDSVDIPEPLPFVFATPVIEEPSCSGLRDGKAEVVLTGGTVPYAYNWSTGSVTKDIINVAAGTYSVVITDANLCSASPLSIVIGEPQSLRLDTLSEDTHDVTCNGLSDGKITLQRLGGNGGNTTYTWSGNVSKTNTAENLKAGIYYVTATDRKGCRDSISFTLEQPDKIYYFLEPPVSPRCYGELTYIKLDTAFGSTYIHPFTVSVDNGPQYPIGYEVPVFADDHLITITEQITGCSDTVSVSISQPPPITIRFADIIDSVPIPRILVGLGTEVRLNPIITGALPIDSVSWTPKEYLMTSSEPLRPLVRPLDDRTYKLRVTDVNGCIGEGEILVELERNRNIFIPNVFSPNGDDKNDYFGAFAGVGVKNINFVRIFDRWGELLFQAENMVPSGDPSSGWDGSFRGKPVNSGVYVYIVEVEFEDGAKLLYRGDVTVAR